jgi:hypothetical protein
VLQGSVVDNRSGRPLARARVTIEGPGSGPAGNTVWSDAGGRFVFSGLPAGAFLVSAQRASYATAKYGQRDWKSPGTPIVLEADGSFSVELRLRKLGVATGEVLDENRAPLPGIPVYAFLGGVRPKLQAAAQTDDRGVFRIAGLAPGRYYIRTATRQLEDGAGLLPTYFGQSASLSEARAVPIAMEEELGGIIITPLAGSLSTLRGRLSGSSSAVVNLFGDTGKRETSTGIDGLFQFDQIAPGPYQLLAEGSVSERPVAAWQRIQIAKDVEQVTLELAATPSIRLRCTEKHGDELDTRGISVFLRRKEPADEKPYRTNCGDTVALTPGLWELAASAPPHLYVDSVRAGRQGRLAQEIELRPAAVEDVLVTFSAKPAALKGVVKTPEGSPAIGAPVYANPLDPELRSRLGGVRSARSDEQGVFLIGGLPPGRYEVLSSFAIPDAEDADWSPGKGRAVTLEEGGEESVELILGEAR